MRLNADFSERASAHARDMPWVSSPSAGVERKMFDRVGDEVARATSIVRFARGSAFAPHAHHGGEEFLVLEGTFQDEHGDYPAGTYVRNPIDTAHTPRSDDGCTIFVKLWQFAKDDRAQFHTPFDGHRDTVSPGQTVKKLHSVDQETVEVHRWAAGQTHCKPYPGGVELLVLKGQVREANETFNTWSWLRLPPGAALDLQVGQEGALVWLKHGHLINPFPAN